MKIPVIILFVCFATLTLAQTGYQEITEKRIQFIVPKLSLTSGEAQQFWPLFREYHTKREVATSKRKDLKTLSRNAGNKESLEMVNNYIESKVQQAMLLEEYHKKYLQILPPQKVLELYKLDEEFNKNLLKKIKETGKQKK